jgi:hypothetical protein
LASDSIRSIRYFTRSPIETTPMQRPFSRQVTDPPLGHQAERGEDRFAGIDGDRGRRHHF